MNNTEEPEDDFGLDDDLGQLQGELDELIEAADQAVAQIKLLPLGDQIAWHGKMREERDRLEKAYKLRRKPIQHLLDKLGAELGKVMEKAKLDALPQGDWTAYRSTKLSATVEDQGLFLEFCQDARVMHLLQARASPQAVADYLEETKGLPPGVKFSAFDVVKVVRTKEKSSRRRKVS